MLFRSKFQKEKLIIVFHVFIVEGCGRIQFSWFVKRNTVIRDNRKGGRNYLFIFPYVRRRDKRFSRIMKCAYNIATNRLKNFKKIKI